MKTAFWAVIAFALTVHGQVPSAIDSFIRKQAKQEHGEEYQAARSVVVADLNGDGVPDTTVLYTIEGQNRSNNYVQYLAVFLGSKAGLVPAAHTAVGGKNSRSVELKTVHGSTIHLATMDYAPNDPSCCPSVKGETAFVLTGGTLKEEKTR